MGNNCCCEKRKKEVIESEDIKPLKHSRHPQQSKKPRRSRGKSLNTTKNQSNSSILNRLLGINLLNSLISIVEKEEVASESERQHMIEYDLDSASNMTVHQRESILEILDRFQHSEEQFDSYSPGKIYNEALEPMNCTIALSSLAIYVLDDLNLSHVVKRVPINSIVGLILDCKLSILLIDVEFDSNILLSSDKLVDLVKAIQVLYHENTGNIIPWRTRNSISEVQSQVNSSYILNHSEYEHDVDIYLKMLDLGKLSEKIRVMEECIDDQFFLLTNLFVYIVSEDYEFKDELSLEKIRKIEIDKKNSVVKIGDDKKTLKWKMNINIHDKVESSANMLGNSRIDISFLS